MTLAYQQRHAIRERLLGYGGPGGGKSTAAATIMLHTPDVNHFIVDAELDNYMTLFTEDPMFEPLLDRLDESIFIYPVDSTDWKENLEAVTEACGRAQARDWTHYDMITDSWESVQGWFSREIFGDSLQDYFLTARKAVEAHNIAAKDDKQLKTVKNLQPFDGMQDWTVINPEYKQLYQQFAKTKGHVFIAAEEQKLGEFGKSEDAATQEAFGHIGYKPKGQKKLGHTPRTVMRFTSTDSNRYRVQCAKDRGRTPRWVEQLGVDKKGEYGADFAKWYFLKVAKWTMQTVGV